MTAEPLHGIRLLLVDDEEAFRQATSTALIRRGFLVQEAESGERALELIREERPDIVVLDLRMEGMDGLETLQQIRREERGLPVIILTGHGGFDDAWTGIQLEIVDFLQKPVDLEQLAALIRRRLAAGRPQALRETTIRDLMVSPSSYERVYADQPMREVLAVLRQSLSGSAAGDVSEPGYRSVLVYDRKERFLGCLGIGDLLDLVVPPFLRGSPYATYFTGMFLAQCKVVGNELAGDLLGEQPSIEVDAPVLQAVHLLVSRCLVEVPVLHEGELVGMLRDRDVLQEMASLIAPGPDPQP